MAARSPQAASPSIGHLDGISYDRTAYDHARNLTRFYFKTERAHAFTPTSNLGMSPMEQVIASHKWAAPHVLRAENAGPTQLAGFKHGLYDESLVHWPVDDRVRHLHTATAQERFDPRYRAPEAWISQPTPALDEVSAQPATTQSKPRLGKLLTRSIGNVKAAITPSPKSAATSKTKWDETLDAECKRLGIPRAGHGPR